jgi:alpha-ketoglutarate-dependent taurine dioxygenase
MNWRFGDNPRTPTQQANRTKFANAMLAYHALSPTEKEKYRKLGLRYKMNGSNKFVSYYMKNQI